MSAYDVLQQATAFPDLRSALADTYFAIATTRRYGPKRGKYLPFERALEEICKTGSHKKVAIVFGKESKGLDNESIAECDWRTTIPASDAYPSINLAQAVMIFAFSIFASHAKIPARPEEELRLVPKEIIYEILDKLKNSLQILGYREEGYDVIDRIGATFYGLFKRNGLLESEAQMFRGLTRRIQEKMEDLWTK